MTERYFYTRNEVPINHPLNLRFEEILYLPEEAFNTWLKDFRKMMKEEWDRTGCPLVMGMEEDEIIKEFNTFSGTKLKDLPFKTEGSKTFDAIRSFSQDCAAINQFFPDMMRTPVSINKTGDGFSPYDIFAHPDMEARYMNYAQRHLRKDGMFLFSFVLRTRECIEIGLVANTPVEWIRKFEKAERLKENWNYFLFPYDASEYRGYKDLDNDSVLLLTKKEVLDLVKEGIIDKKKLIKQNTTNIENIDDGYYSIRLYDRHKRLLPLGFQIYKLGYNTTAVTNFPPLVYRHLIEKYTENITDQEVINVLDTSAGWGGRLIGTLSSNHPTARFHYIGSDPAGLPGPKGNCGHNYIPELGKTRYEYLGEFFNKNTYKGRSIFKPGNTFQIFGECGEDLRKHPEFIKFKGKIDFMSTSGPYFSKEQYGGRGSNNEKQSWNKFGNSYEEWVKGYLKPTLETIYEWMKPDRIIAWNISDSKFNGTNHPMVQDSIDIIKGLGGTHVETLKYLLRAAPGGNRSSVDEEGVERIGTSKYTCKTVNPNSGNIDILKYEPIIILHKPK